MSVTSLILSALLSHIGAACFGGTVGRITVVILQHTLAHTNKPSINYLVVIIGAVGGGAVTTIFRSPTLFGVYCIGLFLGYATRA